MALSLTAIVWSVSLFAKIGYDVIPVDIKTGNDENAVKCLQQDGRNNQEKNNISEELHFRYDALVRILLWYSINRILIITK